MSERQTFDAFADALQQRRQLVESSARTLATRASVSGDADGGTAAPALWVEASALVEETLRSLTAAEAMLHAQNEALFDARLEMDEQGRRYQQLFEFAPAGYLVTDAAGRIRDINQAGAALLDRPRNALVGKSLTLFVAERERPAFRAALARLLRSRDVEEWAMRMTPARGAEVEVAATVRAVWDARGKVQALYWLLRDESARHPDDLL
jgi:PAS domain S-box-containing protein